MDRLLSEDKVKWDGHVPLIIIGAGACGLVAALRAADAGIKDIVVLERDASPYGSTSMSSGFIPAAETMAQKEKGIVDSASQFEKDILQKAEYKNNPLLVNMAVNEITDTIDWLQIKHQFPWLVLDDFKYPGHSEYRMHAVPEKSGEALLARLIDAVENMGISISTHALVNRIIIDDNLVPNLIKGVEITRPDGAVEMIGCDALILACSGFGGNKELILKHIPNMANAQYFGHEGNKGEALLWGEKLGALLGDLSGCQGHGSVAYPHNILITWGTIMEGGIQVNLKGERFSNEALGYSEQALCVLKQTGGIVWSIFNEKVFNQVKTFPDFVKAIDMNAIKKAATLDELSAITNLPNQALKKTMEDIEVFSQGKKLDPFGRNFTEDISLMPPYYAVKVTGALFHTQGGLLINEQAHVLHKTGKKFPNLLAGGGACCGVSGSEISGYLSGNGLLTAFSFGSIAGQQAAKLLDNHW